MQLTWAGNYDGYRSFQKEIADCPYSACVSAGYYWVSKNIGGGQKSINVVADRDLDENSIGRCSVLVNGGGYGYFSRQAYARYIWRFSSDSVDTSKSDTMKYQPRQEKSDRSSELYDTNKLKKENKHGKQLYFLVRFSFL